ncbi:cyclin-dependent kinase inhibitor 3 isoform X5 [Podarcis raffonei]|uniref:cyclin-dependent kinase inhibitor 3 isoform X5 n=1 Tax=Podarcis raffonei TaxID=65483 RepID=UPI0023297A70|nr:cyclin-dependent kinase inhibitor 3 isoform X5 [Podarcis raffonei]
MNNSHEAAIQANEFDSSDEESSEEEQVPFQVSWLALSPTYSQFLGICSLPDELKSYGVQDVFVLCTRGELSKYRVPHLLEAYQSQGIAVHHHPISDGDTPDIAKCCLILKELRSCLEGDRKTLIHCYGGLGRSCLIAACLLLQISDTIGPQQAIDSLRDLRGSGAIQTIKQYNYLHDFQETLAVHLATEGATARSVSR